VKNNTYNYPYAAGKALLLAEIYTAKKDFEAVERYTARAREWLDKELDVSRAHNIELWQEYYETLMKYYRAAGNDAKALLYSDSLMQAKRIEADEYNLRQLKRAEEQIQQEKLIAEQTRNSALRRIFMTVIALAVIALIALLLYNRHITKKHRLLVARIKEQDRQTAAAKLAVTETGAPDEQADNDRRLLRKLDDFILQNLDDYGKTDATVVAKELSVSRTRLYETIKRLSGKTPHDYINDLCLNHARQMLETCDDTVEAIATCCGFGAVGTFHRLFRTQYGITPAQYRKTVKHEPTKT